MVCQYCGSLGWEKIGDEKDFYKYLVENMTDNDIDNPKHVIRGHCNNSSSPVSTIAWADCQIDTSHFMELGTSMVLGTKGQL